MVKSRILILVIAVCAVGVGSFWYIASVREQRRQEFFKSTLPPVTGGQEMRPRW